MISLALGMSFVFVCVFVYMDHESNMKNRDCYWRRGGV